MQRNNRYYWLKLKEDFFEDDTMAWIEEQKNGKEYCLFYLKLCLKSLKSDGILIRNVGEMQIPYDVKKLAEMTNTDFDTAAVAMELFQKIGLVQISEIGEILLPQLFDMVGSETEKAKTTRDKRTKEKLQGNNVLEVGEKCSQNVPQLFPNAGNNSDTEKEIDIELEKDIEIEYMSSSSSYAEEADLSTMIMYNDTPVCELDYQQVTQLTDRLMQQYWEKPAKDNDYNNVFEYVRQRTVLPNGEAVATIDNDKCALLERAFQIAQESNRTTWNYVRGILQRWEQLGLRTILDIEQHEHLRSQTKLEQAI